MTSKYALVYITISNILYYIFIEIEYLQLEQGYTPEDRWCYVQTALGAYLRSKLQSSNGNRGFNRGMQKELEIFQDCTSSELLSNHTLPYGRIAEIFFFDATKQIGLDCSISTGDGDARGSDFAISRGKRESNIDVTINCTPREAEKKILKSNTPVLFLPWYIYCPETGGQSTHFERYIKTGMFDGWDYLNRVYRINRGVFEDINNKRKDTKTGHTKFMLPTGEIYIRHRPDKIYLTNLDIALEILKESLRV